MDFPLDLSLLRWEDGTITTHTLPDIIVASSYLGTMDSV